MTRVQSSAKYFSLFILFSILCSLSFSLNASEFLEEVRDDALSPTDGKALRVLEIGSGLTLVSIIFEEKLKDQLQGDVSSDRPLKTSSKIGDLLGKAVPNAAYTLGMGIHYLLTKNQKDLDRSALMLKATLYSGAITDILKRVVRETRPNGGSYSFPSGHVTSAFAFSSVIAMEHSLPLGIAANTMAIFVGVSRMNDNAHFLQDVIAGATIGTMYGVGLYYAQQKREKKEDVSAATAMLLPINNGFAGSFSFSY